MMCKYHFSQNIENTYLAKLPKSLSRHPCAAKSFSWELLGSNLGPSWAMLGPSWGYLGRAWGLLGSTLKPDHQTSKPYTFLNALLEHLLPVFAFLKPMFFYGFQIALFLEHQTRRHCWHAIIALALAGCSETRGGHDAKCESVNHTRGRLKVKPMRNQHFWWFKRSLDRHWPDKVRGQKLPGKPL